MNFVVYLVSSVNHAAPNSRGLMQQWISIITGPEIRSAFLFSTGLIGIILLTLLLAMLKRKS